MAAKYSAWTFKEAEGLTRRFRETPTKPVTFETGFGPSGLPHIGTFAEVARTTWVRQAFEFLTGYETRLIAFSDDMDGLRKVPLNMPNQQMLTENLGKPLSEIPDPFGRHESYSAYMNHKLKEFLNQYGFDYQFQSSQQAYKRGDFDEGLKVLLENVEEVRKVILPTLGEEKRAEWSPFFPICQNCGRIYTTRVTGYHPQDHTIDYVCDKPMKGVDGCGHRGSVTVLGGHAKVGWKVDWALRWYSYEIDYEMYGKDLIESAKLSSRITRLMGKRPPNGYFYELFLDENAAKISKSVGKGLTVDTWTGYAPLESLLYYLFQNPKKARRLFWGMVPRTVDDYLEDLRKYPEVPTEKQPNTASWHIFSRGAAVPDFDTEINFSLINNLVSGLGSDDADLVTEFLERYDPTASQYHDTLHDLVEKSLNYYRDFILPDKHYRIPTSQERGMLRQMRDMVQAYDGDSEKELQTIPFNVARENDVNAREVFTIFYEVVLGQSQGPRFGTFARLLGKERVIAMLDAAIERR